MKQLRWSIAMGSSTAVVIATSLLTCIYEPWIWAKLWIASENLENEPVHIGSSMQGIYCISPILNMPAKYPHLTLIQSAAKQY